MKNILKYLSIASFTILAACNKNEEIKLTPTNKVKVGEAYAPGASTKIQLWADADLSTGYNNLYIIALDSATKQQKMDAVFNIKPMMTITMASGMKMKHSSPFEEANASSKKDGMTPASGVFSMPTTESGAWTMEVKLNNNKTAIIPIMVKEPKESRLFFITTTDKITYMVALIPNPKYKIGVNDFELKINKRVDGMTYTPVNDFSIEVTPQMPDMGHGSPNNVNPVLTKNGYYKGKVNFTMTGYWNVNLKIKDASGVTLGEDTAFKIVF